MPLTLILCSPPWLIASSSALDDDDAEEAGAGCSKSSGSASEHTADPMVEMRMAAPLRGVAIVVTATGSPPLDLGAAGPAAGSRRDQRLPQAKTPEPSYAPSPLASSSSCTWVAFSAVTRRCVPAAPVTTICPLLGYASVSSSCNGCTVAIRMRPPIDVAVNEPSRVTVDCDTRPSVSETVSCIPCSYTTVSRYPGAELATVSALPPTVIASWNDVDVIATATPTLPLMFDEPLLLVTVTWVNAS